MKDMAEYPIIGRWRIVGADLWDTDFLDLLDPASVKFSTNGGSGFNFGAVTGTMECSFSPTMAFFNWMGSDEMNEVFGDGDAEILEDGTLELQIRFQSGDETVLTARKY